MKTESLWSVAQIAEYLNLSTKHVQDRVVCMPDFPRRIKIPTVQGLSHPRWKKQEVIDHIDSFQEKAA